MTTKRRRSRFYYTYSDLSRITGLSIRALQERRKRGQFDIKDLESVARFIVVHLLKKRG